MISNTPDLKLVHKWALAWLHRMENTACYCVHFKLCWGRWYSGLTAVASTQEVSFRNGRRLTQNLKGWATFFSTLSAAIHHFQHYFDKITVGYLSKNTSWVNKCELKHCINSRSCLYCQNCKALFCSEMFPIVIWCCLWNNTVCWSPVGMIAIRVSIW